MAKKSLLFLIRVYQTYISPLKGPTCRYYPTCSEYARQAINVHGPLKGFLLAVWRLLRCNPFSYGGYDPVPPPEGRGPQGRGGSANVIHNQRHDCCYGLCPWGNRQLGLGHYRAHGGGASGHAPFDHHASSFQPRDEHHSARAGQTPKEVQR